MSPRRTLAKAVAVIGLAGAQLRRSPRRTALAVGAVTLAVLAVTLLASLGAGVYMAGEEGIDDANRDVWITGEPLDDGSDATANSIVGSHEIAAETTARDDVRFASPIAMHSTYVGTDPDELEPVTSVGVVETHGGFEFDSGEGFNVDEAQVGATPPADPGQSDVVLDPALADALDVSVGDTVYLGTSQASAEAHEFTVVGTSDHYSQFLGEPAVTVRLAELQAVAGTRATDRATFITVAVDDDADRGVVRDDLAATYPDYDVRTSDEQLDAMIADRGLVVASGVTLVGLAIVGGAVLTVNVFVLVAYQQRRQLAALRALGLSRSLLAGMIGSQAVGIGLVGGLVALATTPALTRGLNRLAQSLVGFEDLLQTPPEVYAIGLTIAVGVGSVAALVAGWRAGRYARIAQLES